MAPRVKHMFLQQLLPSGQTMARYAVNASNWCLVPMNTLSQGPPDALQSDGTFYLAAGSYLILATLCGTQAISTQAAIAPVGSSPLDFPFFGIVSQTPASRNGDCSFSGFMTVQDDGSGGSLLGIYQYVPANNPINTVSSGELEVYASVLIIPQSCPNPPLQFTLAQTSAVFAAPVTVPALTWTPLYLNASSGPYAGLPAPGALSFALAGGTYLVSGLVGASPSGSVAALATVVPGEPVQFNPADLLLESAGGSVGDPEFQGFITIPEGGALVAVFVYALAAEQVGYASTSLIVQEYVTLSFSLVGSAAPLFACPPLLPVPSNFVVSESLPSGTNPEGSMYTNPTTAYRQVLLNTLSGLPATSFESGAFLLPQGSWYVQGVTTGPLGRVAAGALLASVDLPQITFQQGNVLLQGTNCFLDNMHFDGIVTVASDTWVALFTTYPATGIPFGNRIGAGVPEVYTRLLFMAVPQPAPPLPCQCLCPALPSC